MVGYVDTMNTTERGEFLLNLSNISNTGNTVSLHYIITFIKSCRESKRGKEYVFKFSIEHENPVIPGLTFKLIIMN